MMKSLRARSALVATVSFAALTVSGQAHAQDADDTVSPGGIPEIVVTAQRRAESLQDVPVAVSAFSEQALEQQQIENTQDLQFALPNTTFAKSNFGTGANITIRGIGSAAVATSGDSGVGVHFNDMPLLGSGGLFDTEFFDLERVEVLRGPQGTLFGRNATGGVINLISAKPELGSFGAFGEIEYGNFNALTARGMVNVPVGDSFGIRLAGIYLNRDGYTENLNTGNDIDGRDNFAVRGTIAWEPTDRTRAYVTANYTEEDSNRSRIQKQLCAKDPTGILGCRPDRLAFDTVNGNATLATILTSPEFLSIAASPALAPFGIGSIYGPEPFRNAVNPDDFRTVAIDFEPTYNSDGFIIQGELEHDFDNFTVSINGGYNEGHNDTRTDYNLTTTESVVPFVQGLQAVAGGAFGPEAAAIAGGILSTPLFQGNQICVSDANRDYVGFIGGQVLQCTDNTSEYDISGGSGDRWSVEGRIASDLDGPFNFLLGGLYLKAQSNSDYFVVASQLDYASLILGGPASGFAAAVGPPFFNSETNKYELESAGVFGEVYFDITDALTLTGGLRYSSDEKFVRDRQFLLNVPIAFGSATATDEALTTAGFDADPGTPGNQAFREQDASFDAFTGRVVLDWNPVTSFSDDTLIYASYSRGYKPGGINPPFDPAIFQAPAAFDSEFINAFEIGTKNVFGGGSAVVNLTAFYYDYTDFQVSRIVNRTSFNDNTDATIYGAELETVFNPVDPLTINATVSYQKTDITDLSLIDTRDPSGGRSNAVIIKDITAASNCVFTSDTLDQATLGALVTGFNQALGLQGAVPVPGTTALGAYSICSALAATAAGGGFGPASSLITTGLQADGITPLLPDGVEFSLAGNELLNSPNWKFAVGAQYEILMDSGWSITPRVDLSVTGDFWATNFNRPVDKMSGYEIVNAQITVRSPDERFYIRGFIQNAFDEVAQTGRYVTDQSSGLFTNIFLTDPRRYGAAVGFRF
ncbi:MAG: TonB-dependent receptor [Pacificimonas sp.]|jgi:outer membrane receptor protein involved in Fe transport|nr:TonB-dependent receptor [Pacificimonas sp.]